MQIVVLDYCLGKISVIDAPDSLVGDDVEIFLDEQGYRLNGIAWMAAPVEGFQMDCVSYSVDCDHVYKKVRTQFVTGSEDNSFNINS